MVSVSELRVKPLSMVTHDGLQRVDLTCRCEKAAHFTLQVFCGERQVAQTETAFQSGNSKAAVLLPLQGEAFAARWRLVDRRGDVCAETEAMWTKPREWTMYIMVSSHTDIGLHNSQYIQRYNSCRFVDMAKKLADETADRPEHDRYRYTMEGTWFWNNYGMDRDEETARQTVRDYIHENKLGVCCGIAGNHIQTYGFEQLCRSAYERKRLAEDWDIHSETMSMIDMNGMTASLIQPYAQAGVKNIIFAPNQWNPLPSTVWKRDAAPHGYWDGAFVFNADAGGGGSRMDMRWESALPMVFWWEDDARHRVLVWGNNNYCFGAACMGLGSWREHNGDRVPYMEDKLAEHLPVMEQKVPFDLWLAVSYMDDEEPNLNLTDTLQAWNAKWQWPKFTTLGDPDIPFRRLREEYGDVLPVLRGDLTAGWYQHPVTAAELLARKFAADRALPTAEKWAAVAGLLDETHTYPAVEFRRAWDQLLWNDEHSYGTSGYQGRRVYETWMQHRDWIEKAEAVARKETDSALAAIAGKVTAEEPSVLVFNPTALPRAERVEAEGKVANVQVPPFGYRAVEESGFADARRQECVPDGPPFVENEFYSLVFAENGTISSVWDKQLQRELLDTENAYRANEAVYTNDDHKTFFVPGKAAFRVVREKGRITVHVDTELAPLGARLRQSVTLWSHVKRIDLDNRIGHARDMVNSRRYHRYLYMAFPFKVENSRRYCHLNGKVLEYAKDVTGHGTDVYMPAREWCCVENGEIGAALLSLDTQLMEFDRIHPDKTDFGDAGEGSQMFVYAAADWLQMHLTGGSHLDYRFRYAITSYAGGYAQAGIPQMAELYANPVETVHIGRQAGVLPQDSHSFLAVKGEGRLLCVKRADDGRGIIVRLHGDEDAVPVPNFGEKLPVERVCLDERAPVRQGPSRFNTYRIGGDSLRLKERPAQTPQGENGAPAPIGSVYTGLITRPRAFRGSEVGQLYLLWGRSTEPDLSHYELYRSEQPDFTADEGTFLAKVQQEEYRVGRYEDTGLKEHTCYYYKVCAVNARGQRGEMSPVFCGITKESLESEG